MTMDEKYGDGSDHTVCEKCGLCITCGDCAELGCGNASRLKKIKKRMEKLIKDGQQKGWRGTLAATYVRDVGVLFTEIDRLQKEVNIHTSWGDLSATLPEELFEADAKIEGA